MTGAEERIRETIREHNLIEHGDHIVIGLSGGPDSVCLFHVLLSMAEEMDLAIHPVHVNHGFRPGAAEEDQNYVERLTEGCGLKTKVFTVDCSALAEQLGMTSEEAGRKARYDAFFRVAAEVKAETGEKVKIAVGHNANDQAETVLFRILRGTGMDGIAGMAYAREEIRGEETFLVVRPLLDTWREDVEAYCEEHNLDPVSDQTNSEELYTRNKIRLDLIPHIKEKYNSNFEEGLVRMAKIAAADKDFFWTETSRAYEELKMPLEAETAVGVKAVALDWRRLAACHEALRHRIVLKAFDEIGLTQDITAERLEAADSILLGQAGGKTVEFPHGYSLCVGRGVALFMK